MIAKSLLKEVIGSNDQSIRSSLGELFSRKIGQTPVRLNKTAVFYGVRRSGKTYILYQNYLRYGDNALYIDLEDDRLAGFELTDFNLLKDAFLELRPNLAGRKLVFLLDEVQRVEGWERFCRRVSEKDRDIVMVSGSSSKIMPAEIATELRGRAWSIEVLPFSFEEVIGAKGMDTADKSLLYAQKKTAVKKLFNDYLKWGGFPEVMFVKTDLDRSKLLREYLSAMFFRDLVERYNITNIPLFEHLSEKLFSSFSTKLSLTSVYNHFKGQFSLSKDSLYEYYKHFIESMLLFEVRKYAESTYQRIRNPPKIYIVDAGLCKKVTSADSGRMLENTVCVELRRRGYELYYFEGRKECDFIAKNDRGNLFPIQVCLELNDQTLTRELEGITEACKYLGVAGGTIVTLGDEREIKVDGFDIHVVPGWKWCLA
jgi:uncharacterized protein